MARDIYVVTHAQSEHHVQGVVGGWHDTSLTELGRRQADLIAGRITELVGAAPVEVWASDLKRAAETAGPIAGRLGVEPRLLSDLREKSLGVAGGRPIAWLERTLARPSVAETVGEARGFERGSVDVADLVRRGLFKREYRDHRLEWMLKSGGVEIVLAGLKADNIRFAPDFH